MIISPEALDLDTSIVRSCTHYPTTIMLVLLTLVLLGNVLVNPAVAQSWRSVRALLGEDVTLNCAPPMLDSADCVNYFIHWQYLNVNGRGIDISYCASLYPNGNANRISVDITGNSYTLYIVNVHNNDEGTYKCLSLSSSQPETVLDAQLRVYEPSCSTSTSQLSTVGDEVSLTCSLPMYRALQWIASNGTVLARRDSNNASPLVLSFTTTYDDNFERFTCVATSISGAYDPECLITPLEYRYVDITPTISGVKPGDDVKFFCNARLGARGPHRYNYTWLQDDVIKLHGVNITSYTIQDFQLADNVTRVRCKASIDEGTGEMNSTEAVVYVQIASYDVVSPKRRDVM